FKDGMVFQKKDNYELVFSSENTQLGKVFRAKIKGFGTIEVFRVVLPQAECFGDQCIFNDDLLIGFLRRENGNIRIERKGDEFTGYIEISEKTDHQIDLDPFVILQAHDRYLLLKEYAKLLAFENKIGCISKPYSVLSVQNIKDELIERAKEKGIQVLLLRKIDRTKEFVQLCKDNGFLPGIAVNFSDPDIGEFKKMGFEFFLVDFEHRKREDVESLRNVLKDSIVVAKNVSLLDAAGLIEGLVVGKNERLEDLLRMSLIQKVMRLYLEMNSLHKETLDLCEALGFGVVFNGSFERIEYAKFCRFEKMSDEGFELLCFDKTNTLKRLFVTEGQIRIQVESTSRLVKEVKIRPDGRSFYFYREG
ncbi:MAG TPA: hypothetical protein VIL29_08665, partial [Pseudothermotoga sp.]